MTKSLNWILLLAWILIPQQVVFANTAEFNNAATKVTDLLLAQGKTTVAFETIQQRENAIGNFGPGLRAELMLAFEAVNRQLKKENKKFVTIGDNATFKVRGNYSVGDDPDDIGTEEHRRQLAVRVTLEITDGAEKQSDFTFYLSRERDIIAAEGLNVRFTDQQQRETRQAHSAIRRARKAAFTENGATGKPHFFVDGSKIKTSQKSDYAVELLTRSPVGKKYNPREPKSNDKSLPFVPIGVGEVYGVKIYNNSDQEIGVAMKIDGIDQFTFSEERNETTGRPRFNSWIIAPHSSFTIKGWHISADNSRDDNLAAFQVTKYGDGASKFVSNVDPKSNGVITVAIANSFDPRGGKSSATETGFGPPVKQNQKVVQRKFEPPHEFLAIRYSR